MDVSGVSPFALRKTWLGLFYDDLHFAPKSCAGKRMLALLDQFLCIHDSIGGAPSDTYRPIDRLMCLVYESMSIIHTYSIRV